MSPGLARSREVAALRAEVERLRERLEDLVDRQHDYPTDLSRDRGWAEAFDRAREELKTGADRSA
jgi:hypothetical protein